MQQIVELIHHYGVLAVCVSVLLEGSGLPFPSYPVLMLASAISLDAATTPLVLVAAVAAAITADTTWYFAGARLGPRLMSMVCRMSMSPDNCVRSTQSRFARIGPWALLLVKFLPGIALATIVLSGVTRLRLARFLLFDTAGSIIYLGLPLVLGRVFHNAIAGMLFYFAQFGAIGASVVVCFIAGYLLARWIQRRSVARRLQQSRISAAELAAMMAGEAGPVVVQIYSSRMPAVQRSIPGAIAATRGDLAAAVAKAPKQSPIILYTARPNPRLVLLAAKKLQKAGYTNIRPLTGGLSGWVAAGYPVTFRSTPGAQPAAQQAAQPAPERTTVA